VVSSAKTSSSVEELKCLGSVCGPTLNIVVDQEPSKIICLKPVVKMDLIEIRGDDFLSQLMSVTAQERNLQARQVAIKDCVMRFGLPP
jgi:hypothetical protein